MKLTLAKCEYLDDWFVLEGGTWRASIEGTSGEWLEIADGLNTGKSVAHRRCCAVFNRVPSKVCFWSPRNSMDDDYTSAPVEKAKELAEHIKAVLASVFEGVEIGDG